jgi:hypothetical protein
MGDIGTHAEISKFVIAQARRVISDADIRAADYTFLELGNFLTDVSQFRDPPSYHRAREQAWSTAGFGGVFFGSNAWVRDVFGRKEGPLHGALPEMLRLFMVGASHLIFDDDALPAIGAVVGKAPVDGPSMLLSHGMPPADVTTALESNFTQYYPHEHLDALPLHAGAFSRHRQLPSYRIRARGLLEYLEWYLDYLSEELTRLELEWLRARNAPGGITPANRQKLLLQLGHVLHAVEDYFFHSNLPELYAWAAARTAALTQAPNQPLDRVELTGSALARTRLDATSVPLRRVLERRLSYPVYDSKDQLSSTTSEDATDIVYTGGFGQTDVWHTLGGALEGLEDQVSHLPDEFDPRKTPLVLFKLLLSSKAREEMVQNNSVEAQRALHFEQLSSGEYHGRIKKARERHMLCAHAEAALLQAFDLDMGVSKKHTGRFAPFPGPGAVLVNMMDMLQKERAASATAKAKLDADPNSIGNPASDNTCSGENIGTHTLMSKDTAAKEPLRPEAVAMAKHASAGIALRFLSRVSQPAPTEYGVDWDNELRFFVRGPVPGGWETELISAVQAPGKFTQPDPPSLHDQPRFPLLGPGLNPAKLAIRRAGGARVELEGYYQAMEN